jgi:hypothetical protein
VTTDPLLTHSSALVDTRSTLIFGFLFGFGGAFAYAKQMAAFAAGVMYPSEAMPSTSLSGPPAGTPLKPPPGAPEA